MSFTVPGFYGPSNVPNTVAFYLTLPNAPVLPGMQVTGLQGLQGTATVTGFTSNVYGDVVINPGPPAISFPYVSNGLVTVTGTSGSLNVNPSSILQLTFSGVSSNVSSNVFRGPVDGTFTVYVTDRNFTSSVNGLLVKGISSPTTGLFDVSGNVTATSDLVRTPGISNVLVGTSIKSTQYYSYFTATSDQYQLLPTPGQIIQVGFSNPALHTTTYYGIYDPTIFDATNIVGVPGELRSNIQPVIAPADPFIEMSGRGAGTGALTALAAIGPQEKYMFGGQSIWMKNIRQHTPFAVTQRFLLELNSGGLSGFFLDNTTTYSIDIFPRDAGDLISNMYLSVSLPALPAGYFYTPLVGRAILRQVEFLIDGNPIEILTDDWYILRDQLFLDADEKLAMYQAVSAGQNESNVVPATQQVDMMIPLDFFFCRRHSHGKIGREKLEKPFFPMCAIMKSKVTIRFTFCNPGWITDAPNDANGNRIDLINPRVLIEEITLSPEERVYYQTKPLSIKIPHVDVDAGLPYSQGRAVMNLTANFPVSMIAWFVRNQLFETDNPAFYKSRYQYGYSTAYIQAVVPVTFFNGVTLNFLDIIQSATLYLNNQNVLSNFPGALYYSYKQPMDHSLSVPTKNIYLYCFGDNPKEYNQTGYVDFSTMNSNTTHLDIIFNPDLVTQIQQSYTMYLYYYGYKQLQISGGTVTLS
jgi:hypothetical protein